MDRDYEYPRYPGEFGNHEHYNRLVFICSPYRPESDDPAEQSRELLRNIKLAKVGCKIAVKRGCAPFAPHLLYPQFLNEHDKESREAGMKIGLQFLHLCDEMWVLGRKITEGMAAEIEAANADGIPIFMMEHPESAEDRLLKAIFGEKYESDVDRLLRETVGRKADTTDDE